MKNLNLSEIQNHDPPNDYDETLRIPIQFKSFIRSSSELNGISEKSMDIGGNNSGSNYKNNILYDTINDSSDVLHKFLRAEI